MKESDQLDPFRARENLIAPESGPVIEWGRLQPGEGFLCKAIGDRCAKMIQAVADRSAVPMWVPTPIWAGADIACAHLTRPLDLRAMLAADDLLLCGAYVAIASRINRATGVVHDIDAAPIAYFHAKA